MNNEINEKSMRDKSRQQGVSLVLFDMDDVLVHYDRSVRVNRLARLSNRTPNEVVHAIWGSGLEAQADAGSIDDMAYLRQTSALLGCTVSFDSDFVPENAAANPKQRM